MQTWINAKTLKRSISRYKRFCIINNVWLENMDFAEFYKGIKKKLINWKYLRIFSQYSVLSVQIIENWYYKKTVCAIFLKACIYFKVLFQKIKLYTGTEPRLALGSISKFSLCFCNSYCLLLVHVTKKFKNCI